MKTKTDFSKLSVGTKVWSIEYGYGEIAEIDNDSFPVLVRFENDGVRYTNDGKYFSTSKYPTLFLEPIPSVLDGTAFESEYIDPIIGQKCIFTKPYSNHKYSFHIGKLIQIENNNSYIAENGCSYGDCVLYSPEYLIELAENI